MRLPERAASRSGHGCHQTPGGWRSARAGRDHDWWSVAASVVRIIKWHLWAGVWSDAAGDVSTLTSTATWPSVGQADGHSVLVAFGSDVVQSAAHRPPPWPPPVAAGEGEV